MTCLEPTGTALLNGLNADGRALSSGAGTGEIGSTSGGRATEAAASRDRASGTAVEMAAEAAIAAEQAVARLGRLLEVSAQQACRAA